MKKLTLILSLTFGLTTTANAETWSCAYLFYERPLNAIFVREGDKFYSVGSESHYDIVYEDDTMISLHNSYGGYERSPPVYFAVLLDKTKKMFAQIGLQIENHTHLAEGRCEVY